MTAVESPPSPVVEPAPLTRSRPPLGVWWLSPVGAISLVVPLSLWGAWVISDARYRAEWRTPKVLDDRFTVLMLLGMTGLLLGAAAVQLTRRRTWRGPWPRPASTDLTVLHRAATWTFWATVFGYVALMLIGASRGVFPWNLVVALVTATTGDGLKDSFAPIAGVSTFTQVGIAHVVIATLLVRRPSSVSAMGSAADRAVRRHLVLVVVLGALRAFLLSERLAVLELAVPIVAVVSLRLASRSNGAWRRRVQLAPVVLVPVLVAAFGAFEYARSWQTYKLQGGTSFADFVLVRFAGYYATAYNNAAISEAYARFPGRLPYWVAEGFWTAPGLQQLGLYRLLTGGSAEDTYGVALAQHGNVEFNNYGGLGEPFVDLGPVGGVIYLTLLGVVAALCWNSLVSGRAYGMLLFPVVLTGLYELPRYLYLSQGRVLPALVVLALVAARLERGRPLRTGSRVGRRLRRMMPPVLLVGGRR